jgi:hypothetical protein
MCMITESDVLLRAKVEMPSGCILATDEFDAGWKRMRTGGVARLGKKIQTRGWSFLRVTDGALRSGVGDTSQKAIACALSLALRQINSQSNAIEIEQIELTQYPWFFLARVRVYPYRIQQGVELPMLDEAVPAPITPGRRRIAKASGLFEGMGSAMPMPTEMFTGSGVSELGAQ